MASKMAAADFGPLTLTCKLFFSYCIRISAFLIYNFTCKDVISGEKVKVKSQVFTKPVLHCMIIKLL